MCLCMLRFLLQKSKQFIDVSVPVVSHEQYVPFLKLGLRVTPFQLRVWRPGKDEAVEDHGWVLQTLLDILDPLVEQNLPAGRAFVQKAVRLDEGDILFSSGQHPQNEVGVEVARLEESHTA